MANLQFTQLSRSVRTLSAPTRILAPLAPPFPACRSLPHTEARIIILIGVLWLSWKRLLTPHIVTVINLKWFHKTYNQNKLTRHVDGRVGKLQLRSLQSLPNHSLMNYNHNSLTIDIISDSFVIVYNSHYNHFKVLCWNYNRTGPNAKTRVQ